MPGLNEPPDDRKTLSDMLEFPRPVDIDTSNCRLIRNFIHKNDKELSKKDILRTREYSGTVSGVEYMNKHFSGIPFTLYTIKTREGKKSVVRGSVRGDYKGFDHSLKVGDEVTVNLGDSSDGLCVRTNIKKRSPEDYINIVQKKVSGPLIKSYKILKSKLNEGQVRKNNISR